MKDNIFLRARHGYKRCLKVVRKLGEAFEMAKTSASGSFHLFIGKILSTVVLAVGTIILTIFIEEKSLMEGYGEEYIK